MFRGIRRGFCCAAFCGLISLATLGRAQVISADAQARVEALLEDGIALRRTGKDSEALSAFRQAAEIDPDSARVQAQLGVTNQALGHWVSADAYLGSALAHTADPYIERHRQALEQAHEIVKNHVGSLSVQGGPAGADVLLNGKIVGRMPLESAVPVAVGSYVMEVSLTGHYTVSRPISIVARALTRESVELVPHASGERLGEPPEESVHAAAPTGSSPALRSNLSPGTEDSAERPLPAWVPWALGGTSVVAFSVAGVSLAQREQHADRWNDNSRCRNVAGMTREQLCGDERAAGKREETIAIVSGSAGLVLAGAAVWTAIAARSKTAESVGLERCVPSLNGFGCIGHF